jgi:hypothetical protein
MIEETIGHYGGAGAMVNPALGRVIQSLNALSMGFCV